MDNVKLNFDIDIPNGFIVFISGVPGVGKTTISYELLKRFDKFRIIEETDLIREVLRGFNEYLKTEFCEKVNFLFERIKITDHTKLLSLDEAKEQCQFMKSSFEQIVARQQRKGIATIINGVHIIPETLNGLANNHNIIYINLYISNEQEFYDRIVNRNPTSYMLNHIPFIYQTNRDLYLSTEKLMQATSHIFNIDVTNLNVDDVIKEVMKCIATRKLII